MAGQFDRIVEELYNKVVLDKGYCDEILSEEGLEYFKKLIESYEKPEIIETYQNGSSWYRVYKDGWCEQGGQGSATSSGTTITLLKNYTNTNYKITATADRTSAGSIMDGVGLQVISITTSNFKLANKNYGSSNTVNAWWQACGYIF